MANINSYAYVHNLTILTFFKGHGSGSPEARLMNSARVRGRGWSKLGIKPRGGRFEIVGIPYCTIHLIMKQLSKSTHSLYFQA